MKSIYELLGVSAVDFQSEQASEEDEVRAVQHSLNTHRFFSEWLSSIHSLAEKLQQGRKNGMAKRIVRAIDPIPILQMSDNEVMSESSYHDASNDRLIAKVKN